MSMRIWISARRLGRVAPLGVMLAGAIGCGTGKSYTHDGDPLLGNFNRPITPTPPPTGPGIGQVWDGGPGIYPAPAIGNNQIPYIPGQLAPLPGVTPPAGGATSSVIPGAGSTNASLAGAPRGAKQAISEYLSPSQEAPASTPTRVGASIPLQNRFATGAAPEAGSPMEPQPPASADPGAVKLRTPQAMLTSRGSAIVPEGAGSPLPISGNVQSIRTVEEGQQALSSAGVKWQRLERVETGEWQFTCATGGNPNTHQGGRQYTARHLDQLQAIKSVLEQIQMER